MTQLLRALEEHPTLYEILKLALMAGVTIIAVFYILRLERKLMKRFKQRSHNINFRFVESIARFAIIVLGVQWVIMSSPLTQPFGRILFQGTAIIGAIAGLAAQPVIADLICGLMISATRPFNISDRVELEDGTAGIVRDITLRHVVIETVDTIKVIIPNSKLNAMRIVNMSYRTATRSIHMQFSVSYDTDTDRARDIIRWAIETSPCTIPGKPGAGGGQYGPVYFKSFEDSSLTLATTVYYNPSHETAEVVSDVNTRVKRAFDANGIEIPYNYMNVVVKE